MIDTGENIHDDKAIYRGIADVLSYSRNTVAMVVSTARTPASTIALTAG